MFISKRRHYEVVDALVREKAALEAAVLEAETALRVAMEASDSLLKKSDSALELALTKYGQAVS